MTDICYRIGEHVSVIILYAEPHPSSFYIDRGYLTFLTVGWAAVTFSGNRVEGTERIRGIRWYG